MANRIIKIVRDAVNGRFAKRSELKTRPRETTEETIEKLDPDEYRQ